MKVVSIYCTVKKSDRYFLIERQAYEKACENILPQKYN